MIHTKIKKKIWNFTTIIVSLFLSLLIANFIFIKISNQKNFPRSLAGSLPNLLLTFYPDTYDKDNLDNYIAVLGDSYSQGGGDAYLNNKYDYSFLHHFHKNDEKNYLNFGRGGFGSISAVSNLIKVKKLSNLINLVKNLKKPKSVIFIFYEGNDLEENIYEYNLLSKSGEGIPNFVSRRIEENIKLKTMEKLTNTFPLLFFLDKLILHANNLIKKISRTNDRNEIFLLFKNRIKKLFGKTIVLDRPKLNPETYINSIKNHNKVRNIQPLQSAAVVLSKEEITTALKIFFQSIKYLRDWSEVKSITILYIPSPISCYDWKNPIAFEFKDPIVGGYGNEIKRTSNKTNNLKSVFIRNKISEFAEENDFYFLDTTNYIIKLGKNRILHGPLDWHHFNSAGYKYTSNFITKNISF